MRVRGFVLALVALGALMVAAPWASAASSHGKKVTTRYYLALGDSLSVGFQPNAQGKGGETSQGYTNDLFSYYRKQIPGLKLVEVGCPGDTTGSLLTGVGNTANAKQFKCDRAGGSQLRAAEAFLKAHHAKGQVALVTLDIGANDVDGCVDPGEQLGPCLTAGENAIKTNIPKILGGLKHAAAKGTALAAMNLYDPVLSDYLLSPYNSNQPLGEASVQLLKGVNASIEGPDATYGFKVADVADAFDSYVTTPTPFDGMTVPENVARVCTLTWACTPPPQGPNIHAKAGGYAVIAGAFEAALGKL
jgi:lysophospholipase L1-like esterase